MKMTYDINDRPKPLSLLLLAFQQMLAILSATIAVPFIIGHGLTPAAAMFGAGTGTIVYLLFTKRKSPVFLGSSFAFIGSMSAAFAGGASMALGFLGLIIGAACAGLVYVVLSIIVKHAGIGWIDKLMPPVVIGPTVAIIGLSLAGNAVSDLQKTSDGTNGSVYSALVCGLITLAVTMLCSSYGSRKLRLIPFVCGILAGYAAASIMTVIGEACEIPSLRVINYSVFEKTMYSNGFSLATFFKAPDLTFIKAFEGFEQIDISYVCSILIAYIPVAFVTFAEHIADHKNLSSVIGRDLLKEPGLSATLLGDGVGSAVGAFFGGCPNTTYGESVACVAITKNASVITIFAAAIGCILLSFISPFIAFISSIPPCVMGGVCIALYGFISVSGFKMFRHVDLDVNRNLFVASVILITGIGGLSISFGEVTVTNVAVALILGILTNLMLSKEKAPVKEHEQEQQDT